MLNIQDSTAPSTHHLVVLVCEVDPQHPHPSKHELHGGQQVVQHRRLWNGRGGDGRPVMSFNSCCPRCEREMPWPLLLIPWNWGAPVWRSRDCGLSWSVWWGCSFHSLQLLAYTHTKDTSHKHLVQYWYSCSFTYQAWGFSPHSSQSWRARKGPALSWSSAAWPSSPPPWRPGGGTLPCRSDEEVTVCSSEAPTTKTRAHHPVHV